MSVLVLSTPANARPNFCASQVKEPAIKLLALHYDLDQATAAKAIGDEVTQRHSILAPDGKHKFIVLETIATTGKMTDLRIRMIFALLGDSNPSVDCVLMGQEILDMSNIF